MDNKNNFVVPTSSWQILKNAHKKKCRQISSLFRSLCNILIVLIRTGDFIGTNMSISASQRAAALSSQAMLPSKYSTDTDPIE